MRKPEPFDLPMPEEISQDFVRRYEAVCGKLPESEHYTYRGYLAENAALIGRIRDFLETSHGKRMLLAAPCGSGKTAAVLSVIAGLPACRRLVLLVPNSIQAQQNARFVCTRPDGAKVHPIPITAQTRQQDFKTPRGIPVSAVYDEAYKLLYCGREQLSETFLVVDEAHLLYEARTYRKEVIGEIHEVEKEILQAGGNVLYMSGTVRKIYWHGYDTILQAEHVDEAGNRIPAILADRIVLRSKDGRRGNMLSEVVSVIRELVERGERPLVRINSRSLIRSIREYLCDLDVRYLTSDEKGFVLCRDPEAPGQCTRVYENEVYGSLQQHAVIPAADVYLVTSLIEVGTSIEGVVGDGGRRIEDPHLHPVFVVLNRKSFNLDQFLQFCSRPRFHMKEVDLLLNRDEAYEDADPGEKFSVSNIARNLCHDGLLFAESANRTKPCRADFRDWNGEREDCCTELDAQGTRRLSPEEVLARSLEKYDQMAARYYRLLPEVLERFTGGIPVEVRIGGNGKRLEPKEIAISEELRTAAYRAAEEKTFPGRFLCENGCDLGDGNIQEIRKQENGDLLLEKMHAVLAAAGGAIPGRVCVDAALWILEHPGDPFPMEDGTMIRDLPAKVTGRLIRNFADLDPVRREYLRLHFFHIRTGNKKTDRKVRGLLFLAEDLRISYALLDEDPRFRAAMELYNRSCQLETGYSWKTIFLQAAQHSASWMKRMLHSLESAWFNTMTPGTPEYEKNVMRAASVYGAQYDLLRTANHGKGFAIPGPGGREEVLFPGGFLNKTIHMDALEKLAAVFNEAVRRDTERRDFARKYTAQKIREMLWDIYVCAPVRTGKEGEEAFLVRSLRKRPRIRREERNALREDAIAVTEHFMRGEYAPEFLQKELAFEADAGVSSGLARRQLMEMNRELMRSVQEETLSYQPGAVRAYYNFMAAAPEAPLPRYEEIFSLLQSGGQQEPREEVPCGKRKAEKLPGAMACGAAEREPA